MPRGAEPTNSLILIAAGAALMFTAERAAWELTAPEPVAPSDGSASETSEVGPFLPAATSPLQLSFAPWRSILWRTCLRTGKDRLLANAAGVVFFGLLAVFPAVTALVMVAAVVAFPLALDQFGLESESQLIVSLARQPPLFAVLLVGLGLLYRPEPSRHAVALARSRYGHRSAALDRRLVAAVVLSVSFRQLHRDLRIAGRGDRPDDVDVGVGDRDPARHRAQFGDRAPGLQLEVCNVNLQKHCEIER